MMTMKLEASRIMESRSSFTVGERVFHVVTEVVRVSAGGHLFSAFVSPVALLVLEPQDTYAISLTGEDLTVDELLVRVPALKAEMSTRDGARSRPTATLK